MLGSIDCVDTQGNPSTTCDLDTCCEQPAMCDNFNGCLANEPVNTGVSCGIACTRPQCCGAPVTCASDGFTEARCDANQFIKPNLDQIPCDTTTCSNDKCCSLPVTCQTSTTFTCPANRALKTNTVECLTRDCTGEENRCCDLPKTCATSPVQCSSNRLPFPNPALRSCSQLDCIEDDCCEVAPTCDSYTGCPANRLLRPNAQSITCPGTTCDENTCCGPEKTCGSTYTCPLNRARKSSTSICATQICNHDECCEEAPTCATDPVACPANREDRLNPQSIECVGLSCVEDDCCGDSQTCSGYSCPNNRNSKAQPASIICTTLTCDVDECCHPVATCGANYNCGLNRPRFAPTTECALATCTIDDCCGAPATCASAPVICPAGQTVDNPATVPCNGLTCDTDTCCKRSCSNFDADSGISCLIRNKVLDSTQFCQGPLCLPSDSSTCCVAPTCANTGKVCPNNPAGRTLIQNPSQKLCGLTTCTDDECCKPAWGPWGPQSQCVINNPSGCGNGVRTQTRRCVGGPSSACPGGAGAATQTTNCNVPCNIQESACISWGDPHVNPFFTRVAGQNPVDCGNCGYQTGWQLHFQGTRNGKRVEIHCQHSNAHVPVILDTRIRINGQDVYLYSRGCLNTALCAASTYGRSARDIIGKLINWAKKITLVDFPELVIAFQWSHRVGIYYSGNGGILGSTYTNVAGLCCHGNRCPSNTQGRRELSLLPQEAMESTIFPTCERQDTCCQRYRNVDFLYNACMVDALESCCAPASDDFLDGDACCVNHLSIGRT